MWIRYRTMAALIAALVTQDPAFAQEWSQWRGPERTGIAGEPAPREWPDALERAWRVEVGAGHSSPVVSNGTVYQFSRQAEREVVRALRLSDGTTLWEKSYDAPYTMNPAAVAHGKGPKSTPLVSNGKVFTLGIHGMLSCHDAGTGALLWQRDSRSAPLYGHAMSPLMAQGKLIVHLGEAGAGSLEALAPETGKTLWSHQGDGPGYASPMLVARAGVAQIVTQTDAHVVGVSIEDGKLLWAIDFTTPYDQNIATPIPGGESLIFAGLESDTFAVELRQGLESTELWRSRTSFYMSSPVLAEGKLIGFSNQLRGHFVALDAETGEKLWSSEGRQGENASLVRWGQWILALSDAAELLVMPAGASSFSPVERYSVADSPTWAHPVPTREGILVKDRDGLSLFRTH